MRWFLVGVSTIVIFVSLYALVRYNDPDVVEARVEARRVAAEKAMVQETLDKLQSQLNRAYYASMIKVIDKTKK